MIPRQNNWIPLTKKMIQTRLGHPVVGSPKARVLIIITNIIMNDTRQKIKPTIEAMANGAVEKATIPSMAYKNSFQNDHLVSPATRSTFSNSNHLVL